MPISKFGYSGSVDSSYVSLGDRFRYIYGKCQAGGTLDCFYLRVSGQSSSEYTRCAIYESSSKELVAQTNQFTGNNLYKEWISGNFGPSSVTNDTIYILAVWGDGNTKQMWGDVDTGI